MKSPYALTVHELVAELSLEAHFEFEHNNPPAPFNPHYRADWSERSDKATDYMMEKVPYIAEQENSDRRELRAKARKDWYDSNP